MLVMGISMSLSGIFSSVVAYAIRGDIQGSGGVEQVGLFHAGFAIMTTYVGMVMNAIATGYYPRLAAWVISYLFVAKVESKLFLKLELSGI